jgi:hypothetical protein
MAQYEKSGAARTPQWEPDIRRIVAGAPFTTDGLSESEAASVLTPCPAPILAQSADGKRGQRACPGVRYPGGPWERRSDRQGNLWWVHAEFDRRARMACFRRRALGDADVPSDLAQRAGE